MADNEYDLSPTIQRGREAAEVLGSVRAALFDGAHTALAELLDAGLLDRYALMGQGKEGLDARAIRLAERFLAMVLDERGVILPEHIETYFDMPEGWGK